MVRRRIGEAATAMGGVVTSGDPTTCWSGAALDSRRVEPGALFFALPGERADGHEFVPDAFARGAAGAVVARDGVAAPPGAALIRVGATYDALHALTRAVRSELPGRLLAITGSVGKTTTKELAAAMLGRRFRVARSPGNLNNLYGFPLALLGVADDTEWMVAEMGMSTPGELAAISRLGRPDVALLLNVRPVHLESFGTLRAIAEAKAEILAGLAPDGLLVANADDSEVARIGRRHPGRVLWYGAAAAGVDVAASEVTQGARGGSRFRLTAGGENVVVELPLHGPYNVENCLAAAAAAHAVGVPLAEIAAAAAEVGPAPGRGVVHPLPGGGALVDDSYNSNPVAVARALAGAAALPARRRWAVLGEMLELGPEAPRFHREAGREAARLGFSPVLAVGGAAAAELAAAVRELDREGEHLTGAPQAAERAAALLRPGDVVLVKGSRGIGLEAVVARLLAAAEAE